ncbi:glycosyltransferase family 2 protein [Sphingomonas sp. AOB5]|uniref:glycosyltransferase family 2 protein n=1 Tax=Sphingomonas sp. AOB5 TaxID=3034017 RepID=UPI0023F6A970|nr:glycosyltransferase family 2 protein [Sphingomonas sp. AOB5]MDF7777387.1 glycosyltransferase family 2 protein [Sphingomonas sp. AOB5]
MAERILLFIPCYNCAPQIERTLGQLHAVDPALFDVLVLDNGSSDGTVERATAAAASLPMPVTIARNRANHHLGGSHKSAFAHASREGFAHVAVLHGDDQGRISDLVPLLETGEHRRHDALLGARFAKGSSLQGYSAFRTFGNRVFNLIFSIVSGRRVTDLGSGLNVFARSVFEDPAVIRASDDLRFNVYLLLQMIDAGRDLHFFPISWRETDQLSNVRLVSQAWRTLDIAWTYAFHRKRFHEADHRDRPVEAYAFDVIARNEASHG